MTHIPRGTVKWSDVDHPAPKRDHARYDMARIDAWVASVLALGPTSRWYLLNEIQRTDWAVLDYPKVQELINEFVAMTSVEKANALYRVVDAASDRLKQVA